MTAREVAIAFTCCMIIGGTIALPAIGAYYGSIECAVIAAGVVAFWWHSFGFDLDD